MLIGIKVVLLPGHFSQGKAGEFMYVYNVSIYLNVYIHPYLFLYLLTCLPNKKSEFIEITFHSNPITQSLFCYLPFPICNFLPLSSICLLIDSVSQFYITCFPSLPQPTGADPASFRSCTDAHSKLLPSPPLC